jgi:ubiquinone/menaquinone biosynthesis C-methylase UbiE
MPKRQHQRSPRNDPSRRYHSRIARQYDAIYDDPFWEFHDELTWRLIKPHLPRDAAASCADLGCGTGKWGLRLLKSGFAVTFVDSAAAMIAEVRRKLDDAGSNHPTRASRATLAVADIVDLSQLPGESFELLLVMGDPLSICRDPHQAVTEMHRICKPGAVVIATVDNKLAALDHYAQRGNLDELEQFTRTGRTQWLTADEREQFNLTTFTPAGLHRLFDRAGFEVIQIAGKTILPIRQNPKLLQSPEAVNRLLQLEEDLAKDPAAAARATHLQIAARKRD